MTRIYVAGHGGMVGSAILRRLADRRAGGEVLTVLTRTRDELDLRDQEAVRAFLQAERPDAIVMAAGKTGGAAARAAAPAEFIYENLMMEANVIHEAHQAGVQRLVRFVPACVYPIEDGAPIGEDRDLFGVLAASSEPYAVARTAGSRLCALYNRQYKRDYRTVVAADLYGPGGSDTLLPLVFLRQFHAAHRAGRDVVVIEGSGTDRGGFVHVDDMADGALFVLDMARNVYGMLAPLGHVHLGPEESVTVGELATLAATVTGYAGRIETDPSQPAEAPSRVLDARRLAEAGWRPSIDLVEGLSRTHAVLLTRDDESRG